MFVIIIHQIPSYQRQNFKEIFHMEREQNCKNNNAENWDKFEDRTYGDHFGTKPAGALAMTSDSQRIDV